MKRFVFALDLAEDPQVRAWERRHALAQPARPWNPGGGQL
jgi:hypothetical protein